MAYTIRLADPAEKIRIQDRISARAQEDGRFTCRLESGPAEILIREIRLVHAKIYCGQHAGPCDLPRPLEKPKRRLKILEWFDFVDFNGLVNDVLDELGVEADVWSTPPDTRVDRGSKLWVRRGARRRVLWDVEEKLVGDGPWTEYVADHGSESQFSGAA